MVHHRFQIKSYRTYCSLIVKVSRSLQFKPIIVPRSENTQRCKIRPNFYYFFFIFLGFYSHFDFNSVTVVLPTRSERDRRNGRSARTDRPAAPLRQPTRRSAATTDPLGVYPSIFRSYSAHTRGRPIVFVNARLPSIHARTRNAQHDDEYGRRANRNDKVGTPRRVPSRSATTHDTGIGIE